jgi:predicted DCC family thiol-disulfide oxidoreductase YuxK
MSIKLPVLLFDSDCTFCVRFTQALRLVDGKELINIVPIQNMDIYNEYQELSFEDCSETIHLIKEDKSIVKGADVMSYLINTIPAVKKFAWLLEPESAQNAMNAFYNKVNQARKVQKKHKGCTNCGQRRSPEK